MKPKFVLLLLVLVSPTFLSAIDADVIFRNGKIVTVDSRFSVRQAVAVKGGRIVAVGEDAALLKTERGPNTQVIDLAGRTMLPGLIDSHVHPLEAGLSEYRAPLPRLDSFAAIQAYIRSQAAKTAKGQWIIVPRTFPTRLKELRMPTRDVLDVATEHPVMFDASYVVVVNSLALKMCGITRDTPDPPRGVIIKDEKGEPNGILRNARSLLKGISAAAEFSDQEKLQALEKMLRLYQAAGLTSIGDGAVTAEEIPLYEKLKSEHRLPVRAVLTWWLDIARPADDLVKEIRAAKYTTNTGDDWLKWGAFKINVDGGMTIGTAYQRKPYGPFGRQLYGKTDPNDRGQLFAAPEKSLAVFRAAYERGWQLTAHCQGGGAIDVFLDLLEKLDREKPVAPGRSHWIHASFQSPDAIRRAKKIGVLADVQAAWLYLDGPALERVFGDEGLRYFFPLRSYLNAGVIVAGGSDHMIGFDKNKAVNPYNPFLGMWTAVTRKTNRGSVMHPEERITREEALKMYTVWAAYRQFAEDVKGSIEPGKLADMVVIDRDYLACPEDEIKDIEPMMTILDGKIVYRR
ncbi:MAG TPA: amidohydrolase [Acidobacteriota bacterium]|nr:amidohydrolase [Acidobacteriota bacterium]